MKNRAVFLDRDGTLNVEKHYLSKIEDFEYLPGVIEGLRKLQDAGYLLIIITNQSGIARGYFTEDDFLVLNDWMISDLDRHGIYISKVYYCPHHPNASIVKYKKNCSCRKPSLELFYRAINEFSIDIDNSWAIGDKIRDCSICLTSGCHGILVGNQEKTEIIQEVKLGKYKNVYYASTLLDGTRQLLKD